jgi:hypothetical protein
MIFRSESNTGSMLQTFCTPASKGQSTVRASAKNGRGSERRHYSHAPRLRPDGSPEISAGQYGVEGHVRQMEIRNWSSHKAHDRKEIPRDKEHKQEQELLFFFALFVRFVATPVLVLRLRRYLPTPEVLL